ncbi:hypothetical protein DLAC_06725 [Tieghemostelium lacteum]|uniref:Ribosomal protein S18 n=1 Tax=Tieghemostelium lacteum TaxID=361077 RepID=A0A151ZFG8_TIELA|nr:hypothetical protein DLAC_06725 [Tieghemostelium lacteum]|eukprot:KYQ92722.1 hypothetical protein DLAC_06725 [Tieghemostelium lacteum]
MQLLSRSLGLKKTLSLYNNNSLYIKRCFTTSNNNDKVLSFEEFKASRQKVKERQSLVDNLRHETNTENVDKVMEINKKLKMLDREIDQSVKSFSVQTPQQKSKELEQWKDFLSRKGITSQGQLKGISKYEFERFKVTGLLDIEQQQQAKNTPTETTKSISEKKEDFIKKVVENVSMSEIPEYNVHHTVQKKLLKLTHREMVKAQQEGKVFPIDEFVKAAQAALYKREMMKNTTNAELEYDEVSNLLEGSNLVEERSRQLMKDRGIIMSEDIELMDGKDFTEGTEDEDLTELAAQLEYERETGHLEYGEEDDFGFEGGPEEFKDDLQMQQIQSMLESNNAEELENPTPLQMHGLAGFKANMYGIDVRPDLLQNEIEDQVAMNKKTIDEYEEDERDQEAFEKLISTPEPPKELKDAIQEASLQKDREDMIKEIKEKSQLFDIPELADPLYAKHYKNTLKSQIKKQFEDSILGENDYNVTDGERMRNFLKYRFDKNQEARAAEYKKEQKEYQNTLDSLNIAFAQTTGESVDKLLGRGLSDRINANEEEGTTNQETKSPYWAVDDAFATKDSEVHTIINPVTGKIFRKNRKHPDCMLCQDPHWRVEPINIPFLQLYMNQLGDILPRYYSGNCAKHQRKIAKTIRQAKALGLISYKKGFSIHDPNQFPLSPSEQAEADKWMTMDYKDEEWAKLLGEDVEMTEEEQAIELQKQKDTAMLEFGLEQGEADQMFSGN